MVSSKNCPCLVRQQQSLTDHCHPHPSQWHSPQKLFRSTQENIYSRRWSHDVVAICLEWPCIALLHARAWTEQNPLPPAVSPPSQPAPAGVCVTCDRLQGRAVQQPRSCAQSSSPSQTQQTVLHTHEHCHMLLVTHIFIVISDKYVSKVTPRTEPEHHHHRQTLPIITTRETCSCTSALHYSLSGKNVGMNVVCMTIIRPSPHPYCWLLLGASPHVRYRDLINRSAVARNHVRCH